MTKFWIVFGLPSLLLFGSAAAGLWNVSVAPTREPQRALGDAGAAVQESTEIRAAATPAELIAGILAARARGDRAWLARCLSSCVDARPLTEAELSVAWLRFEWPSAAAIWDKIAVAETRQPATIEVREDRAVARWKVSGTIGHLSIPFVRVGAHWCVADR